MQIGLSIIYILTILALLFVMGVRPQMTSHSTFELRRRLKKGDAEAEYLLHRNSLMHDVFSLQRVTTALLLVLLSPIGVALFHWAIGVVLSLLIALEAGAVARLPWVQKRAQDLYEKVEPKLLGLVERHPYVFQAIRSVSPIPTNSYDIESREELLHMVEQSGAVLTRDEKNLVTNGLSFDDMTIKSVMTPRSAIDSIPKKELLGPLVLDDLHKTGHTRIPVTDGDLDHVVGILYMQNFTDINLHKKSLSAEKAMDKKVFYIREDQSLRHALSAFLRVRHHLFIVVNQYRETVGILSLEDVIEALLGRKIIDEFDRHDDLKHVASRNPRHNNKTPQSKDV